MLLISGITQYTENVDSTGIKWTLNCLQTGKGGSKVSLQIRMFVALCATKHEGDM